MDRNGILMAGALAFSLLASSAAVAGSCPPDSVRVGTACVDKYEASVWQIPPTSAGLIRKVLPGRISARELTAGGAMLIGCELVADARANYPANFPNGGQWTPLPGSNPPSPGVYAVSVAGVRPTTCTSWFRAAQACRLSGKRLVRNDEWQDAAAGTPDPGTADDHATTCNTTQQTSAVDLVPTGSRASCKSTWGAFDMIGNASEWVADWSQVVDGCTSGNATCQAAFVRGGNFLDGERAGVFNLRTDFEAGLGDVSIGFRCAR